MAIKVPVVAHRLFGTKFLPLTIGMARSDLVPGAQIPTLDTDHGTRRSRESITAYFSDEPSLPYTAGWSVNTLWARSDVAFELVGIEDHGIDSDEADLMPGDRSPVWSQFNRKGSINVYFLLEIEGAWGTARSDAHPHRNRVSSGRVVMADRWHLDEESLSREESWRRDVIVLAHEFGHALTLRHQGNPASIMFGNGTTRDSVELNRVEGLVAWQHAWKYSWLSTLGEGIVGRAAARMRTAIGRSILGRLGSPDRNHR